VLAQREVVPLRSTHVGWSQMRSAREVISGVCSVAEKKHTCTTQTPAVSTQ
jgi:hypothetical protein